MQPLQLSPTKIILGRGTIEQLGCRASKYGSRALLVCGRSFARRSGIISLIERSVTSAGLDLVVFDQISANPNSSEVDQAADLIRRRHCDVVIGLGGGSAMDAAKAAAVSFGLHSVCEVIGKAFPDGVATVPVIAVPTTAGSGAEVTKGAIIKDQLSGIKAGVRDDRVYPKLAIVDPELSQTMPLGLARQTAFDALTHAIEALVARRATPVTDIIAKEVVLIFARNRQALISGVRNSHSFDAMTLAGLLGGLLVSSVGTCLPHRIQQAMGAVSRIDAAHASGLAAVYVAWLELAQSQAGDRLAWVFQQIDGAASSPKVALVECLRSLNLPISASELGFEYSDIETILASLLGDFSNDPIPGSPRTIVENLLIASLDPQT